MPLATDDAIAPLIARFAGAPNSALCNTVAAAFDSALAEVRHPAPAFLDLEGMSGRRYRLFANALIQNIPNPRYLEVGVWAGSTLCSAIVGNSVRAVAIDNWSQFGGPRERLLENLARFAALSEVRLIECDFRAVPFGNQGRFNVYLFDGPHSEADQYDGLSLALPALDPEFVYIVGDWNWAEVRTGTRKAIEDLGLQIAHSIEVRTTTDNTHLIIHIRRIPDLRRRRRIGTMATSSPC
jgi:hypothetical protein